MGDAVAVISSKKGARSEKGVAYKVKEGDWTGISEWLKEVRGLSEKGDLIIDGIEDTIGLIE